MGGRDPAIRVRLPNRAFNVIVVDDVLSNGNLATRKPAAVDGPTEMTLTQLTQMNPTADVVLSFPK